MYSFLSIKLHNIGRSKYIVLCKFFFYMNINTFYTKNTDILAYKTITLTEAISCAIIKTTTFSAVNWYSLNLGNFASIRKIMVVYL